MPFGGKTRGDTSHIVLKGGHDPPTGRGIGGGELVRVNGNLAIFLKLLNRIAPNLAQFFRAPREVSRQSQNT